MLWALQLYAGPGRVSRRCKGSRMANSRLKIENARYILTVDPERRILRDGSVVIEGQRITHLGEAAELADVGADRIIDGRDLLITPAFINAHMHISYAHAVRGIYPDNLIGHQRLLE